jgi:hypothetical protein
MSFRHSSAVKTLKAKSGWRFKKCRFSVTKTSAPTHSVNAAIKASAGLSPLISYLKATSKGTTISSSTMVRAFINLLNSWKASSDKFRLTSPNTVRGIRILWGLSFSSSLSNISDAEDSFNVPNAKMYSLESMTKRKFFFPDGFSCFSQLFYNVFFAHLENGSRIFSNYFSDFIQMLFCFLGIFHFSSPHSKITMKRDSCQ